MSVQNVTYGQMLTNHFEKMVQDNRTRKEKADQDIKQLAEGIFSPEEYRQLLLKHNQQERHKWFKERNFFYNGYVQSKKWESIPTEGPTKSLCMTFKLRKNEDAYEALEDLTNHLALLETGTIWQFALLQTIAKTIGMDKFNCIFNGCLTIGPLSYEASPSFKYRMSQYLKEFSKNTEDCLEIGDRVVFINSEKYTQKHLQGEGNHISAIVISKNPTDVKYDFFGANKIDQTKEEIFQALVVQYNEDPIEPSSVVSEEAAKIYDYDITQPAKERLNGLREKSEMDRKTLSQALKKYKHDNEKAKELVKDKTTIETIRKCNQTFQIVRINDYHLRTIENASLKTLEKIKKKAKASSFKPHSK